MADLAVNSDLVLATDTTEFLQVTSGDALISAGMPVFRNATDAGTFARASAQSGANADVVGISLGVSGDGQPLVIAVGGDIDLGVTLTVGETYVLSAGGQDGKIAPESDLGIGDETTVLGIATASNNLKLGIFIGDTVKA